MAKAEKKWLTFEDAFRSILDAHKEFFDIDKVAAGAAKAKGESGFEYDIEVMAFRKDDGKQVLFECRRKGRNLEPKDANEFAYRILTTGSDGYFVTTLERGLSEGAKTIADHAKIGHIRLSKDATTSEYIMQWLNHTAIGVVVSLCFEMEVQWQHFDKDGKLIAEGKGKK